MTDTVIIVLASAANVLSLSFVAIVRWALNFAREEEQAEHEVEVDVDGLDSQALFQAADEVMKLWHHASGERAKRLQLQAAKLRLLAQRRAVEERALALRQSHEKIRKEGYEQAKREARLEAVIEDLDAENRRRFAAGDVPESLELAAEGLRLLGPKEPQ